MPGTASKFPSNGGGRLIPGRTILQRNGCAADHVSPVDPGELCACGAELVESYQRLADVFHEVLAEQSLDALLVRIADALGDLIPHDTLTIYEADEGQNAS